MIDNLACKTAINTIKTHVSNCFDECANKGSSFSGRRILSNLQEAISLISAQGGGTFEGIGQPFSGFGVTASSTTQVTINCGSIGANWRVITIYSSTKNGWFSIYKISNNTCILSANPWYAITDDPVLDDGNFPYTLQSSSVRCSYSINGSSITVTAESYLGQDSSVDLSISCSQISSDSTYMLDTIDIIA